MQSPTRVHATHLAYGSQFGAPKGLKNTGNSCYSNAVLQSLAYCEHIYQAVRASTHSSRCHIGQNCVLCVLERCLLDLRRPAVLSSGGINPASRISQLLALLSQNGAGLTSGRQEDAHEYFASLIGTAQECRSVAGSPAGANGRPAQGSNYLLRLFRGQFASTVCCSQCGGSSTSVEPMQGLELEIAHASTLQAALLQFCGTEALGPDSDNAYACDRCQALTCAEKHLSLREAPPVLRIQVCLGWGMDTFHCSSRPPCYYVRSCAQLKRFAYSESGELRKVAHLVEFPEFLDLSPYMGGAVQDAVSGQEQPQAESRYRLSSVIVHEGRTPHSGHYVCYVRKGGPQSAAVDSLQGEGWADSAQWFLANDEEVRGATPEEVRSQQAYILLYERVADAPLFPTRSNAAASLTPLPAPRQASSFPADEESSGRFGANPLSPDYLRQLHQLRIDRDQARAAETIAGGWGASPAPVPTPASTSSFSFSSSPSSASASASAAAVPKAPAGGRFFPRPFPGFNFFSIKASKRRQERSLQGLGQHLSLRQRGPSAGTGAQEGVGGVGSAGAAIGAGTDLERTFFSEQHQGSGAGQEQQLQHLTGAGYADSPAVRGLKRRRLSDSWCDDDLPLPSAHCDPHPISEVPAAEGCTVDSKLGVAPRRGADVAQQGGNGGSDAAAEVMPEQQLGKRKNGEVSGAEGQRREGEDGRPKSRKAASSWLAGLLPKPVRSLLGWR